MDMNANEPGLIEVGLTVAAFAMCAGAAGGPVAAAITAVLVLVAISRGRHRAEPCAANDNVTPKKGQAINQPDRSATGAASDDRLEDWAAAA